MARGGGGSGGGNILAKAAMLATTGQVRVRRVGLEMWDGAVLMTGIGGSFMHPRGNKVLHLSIVLRPTRPTQQP